MAPSDQDLITSYLNGDDSAFDILMDRYQQPVYYMIRSMIFDNEEAKDITQKTFIKAFNNLKRLRDKKSFKSWLFRIAVNLTKDHLRQKKEHQPFEHWMVQENNPKAIPERTVLLSEIKHYIKLALDSLPPRQHQVVSLRLLSGHSFREIANLLEIKEESARSNFHFGVRALRGFLLKMGFRP